MGYAIRNDQQGWRSVNGPEDVGPDEFYSEEIPVLNPIKTFQQALDELNRAYQAQVEILNKNYAMAALMDGPSEPTKQALIRQQYLDLKASHLVDVQNLKNQYEIA